MCICRMSLDLMCDSLLVYSDSSFSQFCLACNQVCAIPIGIHASAELCIPTYLRTYIPTYLPCMYTATHFTSSHGHTHMLTQALSLAHMDTLRCSHSFIFTDVQEHTSLWIRYTRIHTCTRYTQTHACIQKPMNALHTDTRMHTKAYERATHRHTHAYKSL